MEIYEHVPSRLTTTRFRDVQLLIIDFLNLNPDSLNWPVVIECTCNQMNNPITGLGLIQTRIQAIPVSWRIY